MKKCYKLKKYIFSIVCCSVSTLILSSCGSAFNASQNGAEGISKNAANGQPGSLTFSQDEPLLVGDWPLTEESDDFISDRTGNGNKGVLHNGAHSQLCGGAVFDGHNDYLDVGTFNVSGNGLSISAWVNSKDLQNCDASDCRIISKARGVSEQDHFFMLSTIKVGSETRMRFRLKTKGSTSTLIAQSGNIKSGVWIHVTATYDGGKMRLFVNGVAVGSKYKIGDITGDSRVPVWIGGNPSGSDSRPWKGNIQGVQVHNYALTRAALVDTVSEGPHAGENCSGDEPSPLPPLEVDDPVVPGNPDVPDAPDDPATGPTKTIFDFGFEKAKLEGGYIKDSATGKDLMKCSGNCPTIARDSSGGGNSYGKYVLTRAMKTNYRTETTLTKYGFLQHGKTYWISFDYKYSRWVKDSVFEIAPVQVHTRASNYGNCQIKQVWKTSPFIMNSVGDHWNFFTYTPITSAKGKVLNRGSIIRNKWLRMTVHIKISTGNDGFVEAWIDGKKLGRANGPTGPKLDACGEPMRDPYLKLGIYKVPWKHSDSAASVRELQFDNILIKQEL